MLENPDFWNFIYETFSFCGFIIWSTIILSVKAFITAVTAMCIFSLISGHIFVDLKDTVSLLKDKHLDIDNLKYTFFESIAACILISFLHWMWDLPFKTMDILIILCFIVSISYFATLLLAGAYITYKKQKE